MNNNAKRVRVVKYNIVMSVRFKCDFTKLYSALNKVILHTNKLDILPSKINIVLIVFITKIKKSTKDN